MKKKRNDDRLVQRALGVASLLIRLANLFIDLLNMGINYNCMEPRIGR
jgi:hypothetical protein